jgi:hypothetical protein
MMYFKVLESRAVAAATMYFKVYKYKYIKFSKVEQQ